MPTFNPLSHVERLRAAGATEVQAKVYAECMLELVEMMDDKMQAMEIRMETRMASKEDLKNLEVRLDNRIDKLDSRINTVEAVLTAKITNVDTKLNWLMTLMGAVGVVLALLNFVHHV